MPNPLYRLHGLAHRDQAQTIQAAIDDTGLKTGPKTARDWQVIAAHPVDPLVWLVSAVAADQNPTLADITALNTVMIDLLQSVRYMPLAFGPPVAAGALADISVQIDHDRLDRALATTNGHLEMGVNLMRDADIPASAADDPRNYLRGLKAQQDSRDAEADRLQPDIDARIRAALPQIAGTTALPRKRPDLVYRAGLLLPYEDCRVGQLSDVLASAMDDLTYGLHVTGPFVPFSFLPKLTELTGTIMGTAETTNAETGAYSRSEIGPETGPA